MFNNDPRWDYIWTRQHQFFYDLLKATKDEEVEWFSNQGGLVMTGMSLRYVTIFKGKMVEVDCSVTILGDSVMGRITADIRRLLDQSPCVTDLSHTDYQEKYKELNARQAGILFDKGPVEIK